MEAKRDMVVVFPAPQQGFDLPYEDSAARLTLRPARTRLDHRRSGRNRGPTATLSVLPWRPRCHALKPTA
jgi:hypothetical protein